MTGRKKPPLLPSSRRRQRIQARHLEEEQQVGSILYNNAYEWQMEFCPVAMALGRTTTTTAILSDDSQNRNGRERDGGLTNANTNLTGINNNDDDDFGVYLEGVFDSVAIAAAKATAKDATSINSHHYDPTTTISPRSATDSRGDETEIENNHDDNYNNDRRRRATPETRTDEQGFGNTTERGSNSSFSDVRWRLFHPVEESTQTSASKQGDELFRNTLAITLGHGLVGTKRFGHPKTIEFFHDNHTTTQQYGASGSTTTNNFEEYRSGLVSIAAVPIAVVTGWLLVLLAVVVNSKRTNAAGQNYGDEVSSSKYRAGPRDKISLLSSSVPTTNRITSTEFDHRNNISANDEEHENKNLIVMECASAASPRWLSFPKSKSKPAAIAMRTVSSFFTNTSLASLASSSSSEDDGVGYDDENRDSDQPPALVSHPSPNDSSEHGVKNVYKIGVVKGGKLDVSSSSDQLGGNVVLACDAESALTGITSGVTSSIGGGVVFPLEGMLLDLYDLVTGGEYEEHHIGDKSAMDPTVYTEYTGASGCIERHSSSRYACSTDASITPEEDEILRDLQQLEDERYHGNDSLHTLQVNGVPVTASMISSMLTTAMQQQNQNLEEGVEIWYNAQAGTFFASSNGKDDSSGDDNKDDNGGHETDKSFNESSSDPKKPKSNRLRSLWHRRSKVQTQTRTQNENRPETMSRGKERVGHFGKGTQLYGTANQESSSSVHEHEHRAETKAAGGCRDLLQPNHVKNPSLVAASQRCSRIVFLVAGFCVVASSFSMAVFGANVLAEAVSKSTDALEEIQGLSLEGIEIVDNFFRGSLSSPLKMLQDSGMQSTLYNVMEEAVSKLLQTTNEACNLSESSVGDHPFGEALERVTDLWNEHLVAQDTFMERNNGGGWGILQQLESLPEGFRQVLDPAMNLLEAIAVNQWIVPFLRALNALLAALSLLLMTDATMCGQKYRRWIVPLYAALVVLAFVSWIAFLLGSAAFADVCKDSPDGEALQFLLAEKERVLRNRNTDSVSWEGLSSPLLYDVAAYYVEKCPFGEEPAEWKNIMGISWEFTEALWGLAQILDDPVSHSLLDVCGIDSAVLDSATSSIVDSGKVLSDLSCNFSTMMLDVADFFRCENWYPLYKKGVHDALCHSGVSGFMWTAITQSIVVIMSLLMLTFRAGYFDVADAISGSTIGNEEEDLNHHDTTMIMDHWDCESVSPEKQHCAPTDWDEDEALQWGNGVIEGDGGADNWKRTDDSSSRNIFRIGIDTHTTQMFEGELDSMVSRVTPSLPTLPRGGNNQSFQSPSRSRRLLLQNCESSSSRPRRSGSSNVDHTGRIRGSTGWQYAETASSEASSSSVFATIAPSPEWNKNATTSMAGMFRIDEPILPPAPRRNYFRHHKSEISEQHTRRVDHGKTSASRTGGTFDDPEASDAINASEELSEEVVRVQKRLQGIKERRARLAGR